MDSQEIKKSEDLDVLLETKKYLKEENERQIRMSRYIEKLKKIVGE